MGSAMNVPLQDQGSHLESAEKPDNWRFVLCLQQDSSDVFSREIRRSAQEIVPNLFLGSSESAKNLAELHSKKITSILIVTSAAEEAVLVLRPSFPQAFQYHVLHVEETPEQNLISLARYIARLIDSVLHASYRGLQGRILVHDDGGISRAPAIVIM